NKMTKLSETVNTIARDRLEGFKALQVSMTLQEEVYEKEQGVFSFKLKDGPNRQKATFSVDTAFFQGKLKITGKPASTLQNLFDSSMFCKFEPCVY
uniref:SCP2 domain-containing protein n=1 Tax=Sparus aurata TaxID=8175 RepID=A0A671TR78_SPAAU